MNLYPAIDIYEGKVVRLERGDFALMKVYSANPAETAQEWANQGAAWIHLVDLEGAKKGELCNLTSIQSIRKRVKCRLQVGGGMRNHQAIEQVLDAGADRVVLGTKALDQNFLRQMLERFGTQIAVGLDAREGVVQTQGWLAGSGPKVDDALESLNQLGIQTVIVTDIRKDGMLQGPNFEDLHRTLDRSQARVILSGGVSSLDDLRVCSKITHPRFEGVIIGRALYEKRFNLKEAAMAAKGGRAS